MLRNIVLLVVLAVATGDKCPHHCTCNENFATCNTTNLGPFDGHIYKLKITNPKVPLILKNAQFNVSGLQDVDSISIEYATILDIDDAAFTGIPKLTSFSITSSNIPRINNPQTFAKTKNLRILQITNGTLTKFDSFRSKSLEELDLSGNLLTTVSKTSFEFLPKLTFVNLENNHITSVNAQAFSSLVNLQDVLLSNNNITHLDPNTFTNNSELVSLNLGKNPLKVIDLRLSSDLEKLVLKSCQLKQFDESFSNNLLLLSYLDLSDNNINFAPNTLAKMKELELIDLSKNNITILHSRTFYSNTKLQKIILDNNRLTNFPKLEGETNFETYYLSCSNCSIVTLPVDAFQYMSSLSTLNWSHNKITGENLTAIQNLKNLIDLNLSYNNISVINPSSFVQSSSLKKLNLAGNPLKVVNPNIFYYNRVLEHLDVSNCALQQLWQQPVKRNLESLFQLNLVNNRLTSVSRRDLQVVPFVKVLGLSQNLLHCDEILRETVNWLTKRQVLPLSPLTKALDNLIGNKNFDTETMSNASSWKMLVKERCSDEFYFENEKKKENVNVDVENNIDNVLTYTDDEYYSKSEEDDDRLFYGPLRVKTETKYSFLWPSLVFIFTALSVLIIGANVMLIILRSRAMPRHVNIPHIKIPRWNTTNRLKKYSGSVYQPLSEEKTEIFASNCGVLVPPKSSV